MNKKFNSFFFYYIPFLFILLIPISILVLSLYPHLKDYILVVITLLFLLTTFTLCGQILFLLINAKKNKKILLLVPLLILNIFYIPFYYSKYIEKKHSIIPFFSLIFNTCIIGITGILLFNYCKPEKDLYHKVNSDDKLLTVNFPVTYNKCNFSKTYDLECYDEGNNLTTMIVNYKYDEINYDNKMVDIVSSYADILKEKDKSLEKISKPSLIYVNDKDIYQVVYKGTSKGIKYNFILSSIAYSNKDILSLAIQVVEIDRYKKEKKELNNILESIIKKAI